MVAFASPLDYSTEVPEDEVMLFLICFVFGAVHPRVKKISRPLVCVVFHGNVANGRVQHRGLLRDMFQG